MGIYVSGFVSQLWFNSVTCCVRNSFKIVLVPNQYSHNLHSSLGFFVVRLGGMTFRTNYVSNQSQPFQGGETGSMTVDVDICLSYTYTFNSII